MVVTDFKRDDIAELLLRHPDFDPTLPTAFVYEGCSMYFDREENRTLLRAVSKLMQHPFSRVWCDLVKENVVDGTTNHPEIVKFLDGMEELGEKFIFGCDAPQEFLAECGFSSTTNVLAQEYLGVRDETFSTYQFSVSAK